MVSVVKHLARGFASSVVAVCLLAAGMGHAAACLKVWDRERFTGALLASSSAVKVVDVPDDRTRSTRNQTSFACSARNTVGLWSEELVRFPARYRLHSHGRHNDMVDHFDRVG